MTSTLDLVSTVDTRSTSGVTVKELGEDAAGLRADLVTEDKRAVKDLLIHNIGVFCERIRKL